MSPATIRRRLKAGAFPNATRGAVGGVETWRIPLADLVAAGFTPTSAITARPHRGDADTDGQADGVALLVQPAAVQVAAAEHRAALADQQERDEAELRREVTEALQGQVRVLERALEAITGRR